MKKFFLLSLIFFVGFNIASADVLYSRIPSSSSIYTDSPEDLTANIIFNVDLGSRQDLYDYCLNNVSVVIDDIDYFLNENWAINLDGNDIQSYSFDDYNINTPQEILIGDYFELKISCSYLDNESNEFWEVAQNLEYNGGEIIFSVLAGQETPENPISQGLFFGRDEIEGDSKANLLVASVGSSTSSTFGNLGPILAVVGGILFAFIAIKYILGLLNETKTKK